MIFLAHFRDWPPCALHFAAKPPCRRSKARRLSSHRRPHDAWRTPGRRHIGSDMKRHWSAPYAMLMFPVDGRPSAITYAMTSQRRLVCDYHAASGGALPTLRNSAILNAYATSRHAAKIACQVPHDARRRGATPRAYHRVADAFSFKSFRQARLFPRAKYA